MADNINCQHKLNNLSPGARDARLGDMVYDLTNTVNKLLAKLDAANLAGVGNSNAATLGVALPEARAKLEV